MAISSIQMFQNNGGNSIEGLLRAGPGAISEIMNQAISLGRSMADKQMAQEQDLLNMRQQENALAQRKGENAQQLFTDTMKFNRAVGQDNRDYAANREDRAFDENRQTANDLFSRTMEERRLGLSERKLGLLESEAEAENKRRAEQILSIENSVVGKNEPELPGATTTELPTEKIIPTSTDNPQVDALTTQINKGKEDLGKLTSRTAYPFRKRFETAIAKLEDERAALSKTPKGTVPRVEKLFEPPANDSMVLPPRSSVVDLQTELDSAERKREDYEKLGGRNEKVLTGLDYRVNTLKSQIKEGGKKPDEEKAPSATAERKEIDNLLINRKFFPSQSSFLKPDATEDEMAEAKNWDANRFEAEANAAYKRSEEAYIKAGGDGSPESNEARRKFHRYAKSKLGGVTTPSTNTTSAFDIYY